MWRRHPQEMPRPETENENISTNWKQPWSGKLPCWGTAWHLSDQEKVTSMQAPLASPQGEDSYSQWSDLLELADKTMAKQILWTRKIWHTASHPRLVWLAEEECPHVLVLRGLGVKAEDSCLLKIPVWASNHPSPCLSFPLIFLLWHFAFWSLL